MVTKPTADDVYTVWQARSVGEAPPRPARRRDGLEEAPGALGSLRAASRTGGGGESSSSRPRPRSSAGSSRSRSSRRSPPSLLFGSSQGRARPGARAAASAACAAIAVGLVVLAAWPAPTGLFLGTAIFASGQALPYPAVVLLAMARSAPAERSAVVGAVAAFVDVALTAGAFILAVAAESAGYRAVFLAAAVSAVVGLRLILRIGARPVPLAPPAGVERT